MIQLTDRDLRTLRISAVHIDAILPVMVEGIARELYAHPDALPFYTSMDQVRGQSMSWIRGILGHPDVASLEAMLLRVAVIHRRLDISEAFFIEICAMVHRHIADAIEDLPLTPRIQQGVVRTFTRILFRQAEIFCTASAP